MESKSIREHGTEPRDPFDAEMDKILTQEDDPTKNPDFRRPNGYTTIDLTDKDDKNYLFSINLLEDDRYYYSITDKETGKEIAHHINPDYLPENNSTGTLQPALTRLFEDHNINQGISWLKNQFKDTNKNQFKENYTNYIYLSPDPLKFISDYISKKVRKEESLIKLILLVMASTYTPNPLNLALESPQSEGKSYSLVEVSKIFPKNDVWDLGGMTPQVLTRERGYHVDKDTGKNIEKKLSDIRVKLASLGKSKEDKEERKELRAELTELMENSVKIVDLQGKILLFLEAPNTDTFKTLRPILSHDKYEIEYKFVDRAYPNGPQVTMEARLRGWPVAIYASADNPKGNMWDQIRSRFIVVSPNMSNEKYEAANTYIASKYGSISDPIELKKEDTELKRCMEYISLLKNELYSRYKTLSNKIYHEPDKVNFSWNPMALTINNQFPHDTGQNMRDLDSFLALMDASSLFSLFHRPYFEVDKHPHWIVTKQDLNLVSEIFSDHHFLIKIGELPITIFNEIIQKMELKHNSIDEDQGFTWKDLHNELKKQDMTSSRTHIYKNILEPLEWIGLIYKAKDAEDKRITVYVPFGGNFNKKFGNKFLNINYGSDNFRTDFNKIKDQCSDISFLLPGDFIIDDHFGDGVCMAGSSENQGKTDSYSDDEITKKVLEDWKDYLD